MTSYDKQRFIITLLFSLFLTHKSTLFHWKYDFCYEFTFVAMQRRSIKECSGKEEKQQFKSENYNFRWSKNGLIIYA